MTTRPARLPRSLRDALRPGPARCYRHCDRPVRLRPIATGGPGLWRVHACPSGVVSLVTYTEWTDRDPSVGVRTVLRRWTRPANRVRTADLRLATRHGPELGIVAERVLARDPRRRPIRIVYWRVYPFQGPDGRDHRLFVFFFNYKGFTLIYTAPADGGTTLCPGCALRTRTGRSGR